MNRGHSLAALSHPAALLRTHICLDSVLQPVSVYSSSCPVTGQPPRPSLSHYNPYLVAHHPRDSQTESQTSSTHQLPNTGASVHGPAISQFWPSGLNTRELSP